MKKPSQGSSVDFFSMKKILAKIRVLHKRLQEKLPKISVFDPEISLFYNVY